MFACQMHLVLASREFNCFFRLPTLLVRHRHTVCPSATRQLEAGIKASSRPNTTLEARAAARARPRCEVPGGSGRARGVRRRGRRGCTAVALHARGVDIRDVSQTREKGEYCKRRPKIASRRASRRRGTISRQRGAQGDEESTQTRQTHAPSTTDTIPHRFVEAAELSVGELDIGDSSVTNTRCAFARQIVK